LKKYKRFDRDLSRVFFDKDITWLQVRKW